METSNSYELSTFGKRRYLYSLKDGSLYPRQVIFRALSLRELSFIRSLPEKNHKQQTISFILQTGIEDAMNIPYDKKHEIADSLNVKEREELAKHIMNVSTLTDDIVEDMRFNLLIGMEEKLQTDTWDCTECRRKGLDLKRNCRFREDFDEVFDASFVLILDGEEYRECPMYYRDNKMINDLFTSYKAYDKGLLPDEGGMFDQTEFFQVAWNMVASAVNRKEAEAIEKNKG